MRNILPGFLLFFLPSIANAQIHSNEWRYWQEIQVADSGFIRIKIPYETLTLTKPDFSDMRLVNHDNQEVAYLLDRPEVEREKWIPVASFKGRMERGRTLLEVKSMEDPSEGDYDAVRLLSPENEFLKSVSVEGSQDGKNWIVLVQGIPIFSQPGGLKSLDIEFPKGSWLYLRISLDDLQNPAIPITGAMIRKVARGIENIEQITTEIEEWYTGATKTRLRIFLPAGNLWVASLAIETPDPVFRRRISLESSRIQESQIIETPLSSGAVYRLRLEGREPMEKLKIPVMAQMEGREGILTIENGDDRPLEITSVLMDVVPLTLVFYAQSPGTYKILMGNPSAKVKTYDLTSFRRDLKEIAFQPVVTGRVMENPDFREAEVLPEIRGEGREIDISDWHYRKRVEIKEEGIQRLELDLETLAHGNRSGSDLRLVRKDKQIPYLLDLNGILKHGPLVSEKIESPSPHISHWSLLLPYASLPIVQITCQSEDPVFQRWVRVYEEVQDERGEKYRRILGETTWKRVSKETQGELILTLSQFPETDHLILELDDKDNPPLLLKDFEVHCSSPRLLFKAEPVSDLYLYYGIQTAAKPQYDLTLLTGEILQARPKKAILLSEEDLQVKSLWEKSLPAGSPNLLFWGTMVLVVLLLLGVIAKLIPREKNSGEGA